MRKITVFTQDGGSVQHEASPEQFEMLHVTRARRDRTIKMVLDNVKYILDPRSFNNSLSRIYESKTEDRNASRFTEIERGEQLFGELARDTSGIS